MTYQITITACVSGTWRTMTIDWDAVVNLMDDDIREIVHAEFCARVGGCRPEEFFDRYCEIVPGFDEHFFN